VSLFRIRLLAEENRHAADGSCQLRPGGGRESGCLFAAIITIGHETDLDEFVPLEHLVGLPDEALGQPAFAHLDEGVERMCLTPQPATLFAR